MCSEIIGWLNNAVNVSRMKASTVKKIEVYNFEEKIGTEYKCSMNFHSLQRSKVKLGH